MAKLLWEPTQDRIKSTNMCRFINFINKKYKKSFSEYNHLYEWSIDNIPEFWEAMWEFAGIIASKPYEKAVDRLDKMPGAKWFPGARLNFAENLLRYNDDKIALIFKGEAQASVKITYARLYKEVAFTARALRSIGVQKDDRVVGFMPNMIETIVAMLAVTSIGAIWSSCSPDFGINGVVERFSQIKPKVLFVTNEYFYNGKRINVLKRIPEIIKKISSIKHVIICIKRQCM